MTFISQALAEDVKISDLLSPSINPAKNITDISFAGLLQGNGIDLINFIFIILGLIFFANLVMAGINYMTSEGDSKKVSAANSRVINGLMGLVMAVAAFIIVRLVSQILGLGGSNVTTPII